METKDKKDTTVSFLIDPELLAQVKAYAKKEDRNLSSVIRLALKKLLEEQH